MLSDGSKFKKRPNKLISPSAEETFKIGHALGASLPSRCVVCLFGDLGAGKTTLIKGLICGATGVPPEEVHSPTFVYLHIHKGRERTAYHFDLYRLSNEEEFLSLGFDEYFDLEGICCMEWAEKAKNILPPRRLEIFLSHTGENQREIEIREIGQPPLPEGRGLKGD
jgi:tRNA threonylcarbamoyladenosine biosynthesis protein TsaE